MSSVKHRLSLFNQILIIFNSLQTLESENKNIKCCISEFCLFHDLITGVKKKVLFEY